MRVDQNVMAALDAAAIDGSRLTLGGQLDRKLYTQVSRVLELAGGKWDRRAGAHVFDGPAMDAIEPILLTGEVTDAKRGFDAKREFDAFFTPAALARRVIQAAGVKSGMFVLEPNAGHGALARAARDAGAEVVCNDVRPEHFDVLVDARFHATCADFLTLTNDDLALLDHLGLYDAVVMNPPFSRQQDVLHVTHALRFLKPGGRLAAIMSPSWTFRQTATAAAFRLLVEASGATVEPLPEGSFRESGTMANTVLVTFGGVA